MPRLYELLKESDGKETVVLYLRAERAKKELPPSRSVEISPQLVEILEREFGAANVKVVEKSIEKRL